MSLGFRFYRVGLEDKEVKDFVDADNYELADEGDVFSDIDTLLALQKKDKNFFAKPTSDTVEETI